mmetsp:Transcript_41405/g.134765  ORF Transcript_41405/g.134765 Transcript_41405/m.134765 type:complete len:205 (+) Transcript_41405:237-851(+)
MRTSSRVRAPPSRSSQHSTSPPLQPANALVSSADSATQVGLRRGPRRTRTLEGGVGPARRSGAASRRTNLPSRRSASSSSSAATASDGAPLLLPFARRERAASSIRESISLASLTRRSSGVSAASAASRSAAAVAAADAAADGSASSPESPESTSSSRAARARDGVPPLAAPPLGALFFLAGTGARLPCETSRLGMSTGASELA